MQASILIKCIVIFFFTALAQAQDLGLSDTQSQTHAKSFQNSIELDYRLFSPEILFQLGEDSVAMTPKAAGQPGLRFSRGKLSLSVNTSFFSESSQSGGFDLAYGWDNAFVQAYHVWASGYRVQLNPNSDSKRDLGDRENMTGSSEGVLFLKGFDESSHFSMISNRGPRDLESASTPLQYSYQILLDRSLFEDSSAFVIGNTVLRKERTSFLLGLGAMISESTSTGYVFSSCSLGLGVINEKMAHTTGISEEKIDGAYAVSCLMNLVLQKSLAKVQAEDLRWYGGMSGNVQIIQSFDKNLLAQRLFLVSAFLGTQF